MVRYVASGLGYSRFRGLGFVLGCASGNWVLGYGYSLKMVYLSSNLCQLKWDVRL